MFSNPFSARVAREGQRGYPVFWILLVLSLPSLQAQPLTLRDALQSALRSHPARAVVEASRRAEEGRRLQALSPPAPEITYHEEEIEAGRSLGTGANRQFLLGQRFDIPLLIGAHAWKHGAWISALEARQEAVDREIRASVIIAYATLAARQEQAQVRTRTAREAADYAHRVGLQREAGEVPELDLLRARAEEARTALAARQAETDLRSAVEELRALTGVTTLTVDARLDSLTSVPARDPALALDEIVERHPSVREADHLTEGWKSEVSLAWMSLLPSFQASWIRQRIGVTDTFWGAEFTASLPLWFLFDTRGKVIEARAEVRRAEAEAQGQRLAVRVRLHRALADLAQAEQALGSWQHRFLPEAEALATQARIGRDAGSLDPAEYYDALRSAEELRSAYFDSLISYYTALARYEQDTGLTILP